MSDAEQIKDVWCYIARKPNGQICCAVVDVPPKKYVAETLAEWVDDGLKIERVPVEWIRKHMFTKEKWIPYP